MIQEEERFCIKTYEADSRGDLKLNALMNLFQNLAEKNIERLGYGYNFLISQNVCWVACNYIIDILSMPKREEEVILKTWPCEKPSIFAIRDFLLTYPDGTELVKASSRWFLIDLNRRRPISHKKILPEFPIHPQRVLNVDFEKIDEVERVDFQRSVDVVYDNIDVNNHVNNVVYATWAQEAYKSEFILKHKIKHFEIIFKSEAKLDDKVEIKTQIDSLNSICSIESSGNILSQSKIIWEKL